MKLVLAHDWLRLLIILGLRNPLPRLFQVIGMEESGPLVEKREQILRTVGTFSAHDGQLFDAAPE